MNDFTQLFEIIYDKFLKLAKKEGIPQPGKTAMSRFLGVNHGKMQAWEKGQWPSAQDISVIHQKLGFNLRWLVTGEGDPEEIEFSGGAGGVPEEISALKADVKKLQQQISDIQTTNVELVTNLKDALKELKEAQQESLGWQREYLLLQQGQLQGKKNMPPVTASPAHGAHTTNQPNKK